MKSVLKAIIVIAIAAGVAIPSGFMAYQAFNSSNPSMTHFVPLNSSAVIMVRYNNSTFYAYTSSNSTGLIADMSVSQFTDALSTAVGNNSTNFTAISVSPVLYDTFHGYKIYSLSNITLNYNTSLMGLETAKLGDTLNLSRLMHNRTIYIAELSGTTISAGSLSSVKSSIMSSLDGRNFAMIQNTYFNSTANISFYINYSSRSIDRLAGNVYWNYSTFMIEFTNKTMAHEASIALPVAFGSNLTALKYSYPYLNFTVDYGFRDLSNGLNFSQFPMNETLNKFKL